MFSRMISSGLSSISSIFSETKQEEKSKFQYELNDEEQKQLRHSEDKPKIVALYAEHDGAVNADLAIQHFEKDGLDVVRVSPEEGLSHPTFSSNSIDGIYLPGGSDIPVQDESDPRKRFEGQLTQLARAKDIPLIGICRGEQAIGHHNRLAVEDLPDYEQHYGGANNGSTPDANNTVVVEKGSQLFAALQNEFKEKNNGPLEYPVTCLHHQHIPESPSHTDIQVTGRNKFDNTIESIEIKTGKYFSFGVQHHPEVLISSCEDKRKEKITQVEKEAEEARFTSNFFEPDTALIAELQYAQKLREAHEQSRDERAARAEMGFFTKQVKKRFLEHKAQQKETQPCDVDSTQHSPVFELWG
ncbi:gamma-glutamyl-gamma-aminobutyrate hydrolase family protein [Legionella sp. 227]|uniref:gamma-glutamyl-gamma-aminobutyrate hydrolase family protein n=1 Tax=Legionella sp. 227 TaxID=3367288 RepID=UPI00370D7105